MKKLIFSFAAFSAILAGCQVNDLDENNTQQDGEAFYINATIPSTKTILTPGEGLYNVEWEENEELSVVATYTDGSQSKGYKFTKGEGNTFSCTNVENPGTISELNVIYPYSNYIKDIDNDGYFNGYVYLGSRSDSAQEQNGINSGAHIRGPLYGYATATDGTADVLMKHASTLFEIIIKNNSGADINVSKVSMTNSESKNMVGTFYINPKTGELKEGQYVSATASLNVTDGTIANGASGKLYITSAPFDLAVNATLTITVTTTDGKTATVTKTIPAVEKGKFEAGKVNHINVEIAETEASIEPGEYLIGAYTSSGWAIMTATNQKSEYFDAEKVSSVTKPIESILASDFYMIPAIDQYVWTVEAGEGGFSIKNSEGYLSQRTTTDSKGDKTGYISYSEESTLLSISKENDGTFTIKGQGNAGELPLRYNSSATRFKPYSSQTAIVLIPWIEDTTPRIFVSENSISASSGATSGTLSYSTRNINPEDIKVNIKESVSWITASNIPSENKISYDIQANDGAERSATIVLSAAGADDVEISVNQLSAGEVVYTLTITTADFPGGSYSANNGSHQLTAVGSDGSETAVSIYTNQMMKQTGIQFQKDKGYFYNETSFSEIISVELTEADGGPFSMNIGNEKNPTSGSEVAITDNIFVPEEQANYFVVKCGGKTGKCTEIVIKFKI